MKKTFRLAALAALFGLALALAACSNSSDGGVPFITPPGGNGTKTYTITFNPNGASGSVSTQKFKAGEPQALKTIAQLGFSKEGFNFAGWGTSADATQSSYADGSSYTATANATLYALWSSDPVYSVKIGVFSNGEVKASPASGAAGITVTLTIKPSDNYELDSISVTAGTSPVTLSGTGNSRTFTMPESDVAVTASFEPKGFHNSVTKYGTRECDGHRGNGPKNYDLVYFGDWPQTLKADSVTVDSNVSVERGHLTYCKGNDGCWYVKTAETPYALYKNGILIPSKYKNGSVIGNDEKWFKVEPIKWRVLTYNYNGTGKALLLAEDILTMMKYNTTITQLNGIENKYGPTYDSSLMRAYLNGSFEYEYSNIASYYIYKGKGFLQTAFSKGAQDKICVTEVDNSEESTIYWESNQWPSGHSEFGNQGYLSDNTFDKIFLLSMKEARTDEYGFLPIDEPAGNNKTWLELYGPDLNRHKAPVDFARAKGVCFESKSELSFDDGPDYGDFGEWGEWFTRSPSYMGKYVRTICVWGTRTDPKCTDPFGVVPALCVDPSDIQ